METVLHADALLRDLKAKTVFLTESALAKMDTLVPNVTSAILSHTERVRSVNSATALQMQKEHLVLMDNVYVKRDTVDQLVRFKELAMVFHSTLITCAVETVSAILKILAHANLDSSVTTVKSYPASVFLLPITMYATELVPATLWILALAMTNVSLVLLASLR